MGNIIVIDTETVTGTYGLILIGAVILEKDGKRLSELENYFGFSDEFDYGFYFAQQNDYAKRNNITRKPRNEIETELSALIRRYEINIAFAYNAGFDRTVIQSYLPKLQFNWFDLMKPARKVLASEEHYPAYKRFHPHVELTRNGLLKRGYGVDCVSRYLGLPHETHVAIEDAQMETEIAIHLGLFEIASVCKLK